MNFRNAMKLRKGNQVIVKDTGERVEVISCYPYPQLVPHIPYFPAIKLPENLTGKIWIICVLTKYGYKEFSHLEIASSVPNLKD